ncbi:hypothetical protein GPUN_0260 [Glaciecola punicea ACAM 611]|uniref:Type I restriction modification DNA specificity domain-containing protein n=1 Tax=Glaciecola punicea ACAM 611 TaxID=1121923 RepID=H5T7Y6_9ALTE|nr:restriction endonuclease subunit S [Glaciecola punicea]GAB54413.1 hypothetical protein GPUN_0260 [Glaciecola punicea ACAM 611]
MWNMLVLEDACLLISRGISPKYLEAGGVRVLNQKCIRNHTIDYSLARRHDISKKSVKPERFIQKGDVLINSTGHGTLGRVAQVRDEPDELTTVDSHVTIVRPKPEFFYLDYFGFAAIFIEDEIKAAGQGTSGQTELSKTKLKEEFSVSFPTDFEEQQRIVAKLDAAFAEIDSAIFANACNIIKANEIFSQYLSNVETDNLPLEKLINIKTGKLDSNAMVENGEFPFFTCSREIYSIDKFAFECDAVLLAGNNASGDFNVKHYEGKFNAYQRTYVLTVVDSNSLRSRYLYFQLINALSKFKKMSVGAGTKFLKIGMIRSLEIPLPPIIAQDKILVKLEKLLKLSEELHTAYNGKARQLSSLKSAILAQELKGEAA